MDSSREAAVVQQATYVKSGYMCKMGSYMCNTLGKRRGQQSSQRYATSSPGASNKLMQAQCCQAVQPIREGSV